MDEPRVVTVTLPYLPPPELRGNSRAIPVVKRRKKNALRQSVYIRLLQSLPTLETPDEGRKPRWAEPPMQKAIVNYTFYYCSSNVDPDNFPIAMKGALDEIVDFGILADDNAERIEIRSKYIRIPHRDGTRTEVKIDEVLETETPTIEYMSGLIAGVY